MSPYTRKQIIKHALQYYIQRPNADPKDIHREKTVLRQVEEELEREIERNGIKPKEASNRYGRDSRELSEIKTEKKDLC